MMHRLVTCRFGRQSQCSSSRQSRHTHLQELGQLQRPAQNVRPSRATVKGQQTCRFGRQSQCSSSRQSRHTHLKELGQLQRPAQNVRLSRATVKGQQMTVCASLVATLFS